MGYRGGRAASAMKTGVFLAECVPREIGAGDYFAVVRINSREMRGLDGAPQSPAASNAVSPVSSRYSQALATVQSRLTVPAEMRITSAVS